MSCPVCGARKTSKVKKKNYPARYNGEPVVVPSVEFLHCDHCGEDILTPEQARALSVAARNEVRKRSCLLSPKRIKAIRERANLTQAELEELLGVGSKVVVRWESGKVIQTSAADTLLRVLELDPDLVKTLRAIEAQRCKPQQQHITPRTGMAYTLHR